MRYFSLRIVSTIYHFAGLVGSVVIFVLFFVFVYGAVSLVHTIAEAQGITASAEAYIAAILPPFYFLIVGLVSCLLSYAFGTFVRLMIDIEAGVRSIDYRLGRDEHMPRADSDMWADVPAPSRETARARGGDGRPFEFRY